MLNEQEKKKEGFTDDEMEQVREFKEKNLKKLRSTYRKIEIFSFILGFFLSSSVISSALRMDGIMGVLGGLVGAVVVFIIWAGIPFGWIKIAGKIPFLGIFLVGFFIELFISAFVGWFFFLKYWTKERKEIFETVE